MAGSSQGARREVARNRRARFDYMIEDTLEAGMMLTGSEVKSLREGRASINESYAGEYQGALALINAHITEYKPSARFNHQPKRSEDSRVGQECVSQCRSRWSTYHSKKKQNKTC